MRDNRGHLGPSKQGRLFEGDRTNSIVDSSLAKALRALIKTEFVDLSLFSRRDLGILEALVLHLVEKGFGFSEIGHLIDRDARTIWATHSKAVKKTNRATPKELGIPVPVSIFRDREVGVLENLSRYLVQIGYESKEIAQLIDRKPKTIYTVLYRLRTKKLLDPVLACQYDEPLVRACLLSSVDAQKIEQVISEENKDEISVPLNVLSDRRTGILEALARYLTDEKALTPSEIGRMLDRDPRTIWGSIARSKKKQPVVKYETTGKSVPVSIFRRRQYGILETLAVHLASRGMHYKEIASSLNRDHRTIWTVLQRVKVKELS